MDMFSYFPRCIWNRGLVANLFQMVQPPTRLQWKTIGWIAYHGRWELMAKVCTQDCATEVGTLIVIQLAVG